MNLPKGFSRITVKQIFDLIDWDGESEEQVEIRPESEDETWFTIPTSQREMLSETILNTYVESLDANEDKVCIWLSDKVKEDENKVSGDGREDGASDE